MTTEKETQFLKTIEKMSLPALMHGALYETDPAKKAIYKSTLDKMTKQRQLKIIQRQHFVR